MGDRIRTPEVTARIRYIADNRAYREAVNELLRDFAHQSPLIVQLPDGETLERDNVVFVTGSGSAADGPTIEVGAATREGTVTAVSLGQASVIVRHAPRPGTASGATLTGTWPGSDESSVLAEVIA